MVTGHYSTSITRAQGHILAPREFCCSPWASTYDLQSLGFSKTPLRPEMPMIPCAGGEIISQSAFMRLTVTWFRIVRMAPHTNEMNKPLILDPRPSRGIYWG